MDIANDLVMWIAWLHVCLFFACKWGVCACGLQVGMGRGSGCCACVFADS